MRNFPASNARPLALGLALTAAIFAADSVIPLGIAGGVPYVAVVLIGLWIAWRPAIFILAGLASLLTIAGIYTSPSGGQDWQYLSNRFLTLGMIWTVTLLVHYRRRREDALASRERALGSAVVQSVGALVIVLDPKGHIRQCNHTCESVIGRKQDKLFGTHIRDIMDQTEGAPAPATVLDSGTMPLTPSRCETFIRSPRRGRRRISWSNTPHFSDTGAVDFTIVAGIDITEQYEARELLRRSEELHRNVVENQIDLISRSLPDGTLTYVNDVYCAFFDKPREQLIGRNFLDLMHHDSRDRINKRIEQRSVTPTPGRHEWKVTDGAGEAHWIQWTSQPIMDGDGKLVEYQSVGRDVTERRQIEQALRDSEERHRQLANIAPFAILVHCGGRIVFANPAAEQLFNAGSPDDLIGREAIDLVHPDDRDRVLDYRNLLLKNQDNFPKLGAIRRLRLDGTEFLGEGVDARFRWGGNDAYLFVIQDVTALRQAEEGLRHAKEIAEQADETKSRFLATASHDLRQPLYAMSLFLTTLMERFSDPNYADLLEKMEQSLESANNLLNTVLDISKLDAGVVEVETSTFGIQTVLDQVAIEFTAAAETEDNSLTVMPCSALVRSDRVLLESILRNLVSNAVRYTHNGRILVGCRRHGDDIRILVRDTGPGIPADKHSAIFNEFERLKDNSAIANRGLGLGLAIVKRTASLLGCEIVVRSEIGKGSEFSFDLPMEKAVHGAIQRTGILSGAVTADFEGAIVALIEDDAGIRLAMPACLSRWGCECITSISIEAAIADLTGRGIIPDLLMVDYHLANGTTGFDAIREVRSRFGQNIPAVIITADTSPETARLAREQNVPLLTKPVRPAKLRALLQHMLRPPTGRTPLSATGS